MRVNSISYITKTTITIESNNSLLRKDENKAPQGSSLNALGNYNKAMVSFRGDEDSSYQKARKELSDFLERSCALSYPQKEISDIMRFVNENNIEFLTRAAKELDSVNPSLLRNMLSLTMYSDKDNVELGMMMLDKPDFPREQVYGVMFNTDRYNVEFGKRMLNEGNVPPEEMSPILEWIDDDNIEIAEMMLDDPDFPRDEMADILKWTDYDKAEQAKMMVSNPNFPRVQIAETLSHLNYRNVDLFNTMMSNPDFPHEKSTSIMEEVNDENMKAAELMVSDPVFYSHRGDVIADILGRTDSDNLSVVIEMIENKRSPKQIARALTWGLV